MAGVMELSDAWVVETIKGELFRRRSLFLMTTVGR
jgi:hypothetical protein